MGTWPGDGLRRLARHTRSLAGGFTCGVRSTADLLVPDGCHLCGKRFPWPSAPDRMLLPVVERLLAPVEIRVLRVLVIHNHPFCPACLKKLTPAGEGGAAAHSRTRDRGKPGSATGEPIPAGVIPTDVRPEEPIGPKPVPTVPPVRVVAAFAMNDTSLKIIHLVKFTGLQSLIPLIASAMTEALRTASSAWEPAAVLVPVPMHPSAIRRRGFNQAELIARALSRETALPVLTRSLRKTVRTRAQSRTARDRRLENVAGAFAWLGGDLSGRSVLLVDDLVTTGATVAACAAVLRQAGASAVTAMCFARAVTLFLDSE